MELLISIEAQNAEEIGLAQILSDTLNELSFVTNRNSNLMEIDNYGIEFKSIAIIPSCMDDQFWNALGWKERKLIWRKRGEADIRLRMNYPRFISETMQNRRLMLIDIIVKSIQVVQSKSKGGFKGEKLIEDILTATNVTKDQLSRFDQA